MKTAGELFKDLLERAGFDTNEKAFIDILSKADFSTTQIPDSITEALTSNLISLEHGKAHPTLKKHYTAMALDPFNNNIETWLSEHGIADETINEIVREKSTYSKVEKALKKIAEQAGNNAKSSAGKDSQTYQAQIVELNRKLSEMETLKQQALKEVTDRYESQILNETVNSILSGLPLPSNVDKEIETQIARSIVDRKLEEKGAVLKKINGKLTLVSKDDGQTPIFDNGKELSFQTLSQAALAEKNFLKVNGGGETKPGAQAPRQPHQSGTPQKPTVTAALSHIDDMLNSVKTI